MSDYLGYQEFCFSEEELANLYHGKLPESVSLLRNEYLLAKDNDGGVIDYFRNIGDKTVRVTPKTITSKFNGKIKPRNPQQVLALDMLYDPEITIKVLTGKFGSGKTMFMCSAAAELLEKNKVDSIVWIRNNVEVKNSRPIGHLPGSYEEKLMPYAMPLADHLGGKDGLEYFMRSGKIQITHLGFLRGRNIENSIIMCSEAENLTKEHVQLLIGRVGEGSSLWLDGDRKQVDHQTFSDNNGLTVAIEKLKGHPRFGYVRLAKTERSETAAMADLLD